MDKKVRIGLVYGGKSGEHDVSLQTALAVMNAFDFNKYELVPFYITKQGEWRSGSQLLKPMEHKEQLMLTGESNHAGSSALTPLFIHSLQAMDDSANGVAQHMDERSQVDVIFPLLHGTFGEDGTIQGMLEMANLPYVGAGVLASAVGMDKIMMKKVFAQEGLPQCIYRYFTRKQWDMDQAFFIMEIEVSLGYPCFVKPANLGSSVGISKAHDREELVQAIAEAFRYDRKVIIEETVDGREIEVGILGNDIPRASVPGEVVSSSEFYDYHAKYVDGQSAMIIPADLPEDITTQVREMAIRAYRGIDGSGLARVDFFLRKADSQLLINELNTMPGFTPFSMYPLLWQETGLSYQQLLDELIKLAIERFADKQRIDYGFDLD